MTAGIPGPACSERALSRSLPASPLPPQPERAVTCILQLSSRPKERFSAARQAPARPGRRRLGDKGALDPFSRTGRHGGPFGARARREGEGQGKDAHAQSGVSRAFGDTGGGGVAGSLFALQLLCLTEGLGDLLQLRRKAQGTLK